MDEGQDHSEYSSSKKSKFRFKPPPPSSRDRDAKEGTEAGHRHHRRRHHRHRHYRRHKRTRSPDPERENASRTQTQPPPLSPNAAFRESLFDALADDEGAAYWEGVYGQPIHTYQRPAGGESSGRGDGEGDGELEGMTDEEYATYVRARMWEKTHQGILEEQERRRQAREKMQEERKRARKTEGEREAFQRMVDESLQRGQERQAKKRKVNAWKEVWTQYLESWDVLNRLSREAASNPSSTHDCADDTRAQASRPRNLIVWPVKSGRRRDVTPQGVRDFICNAAATNAAEERSDGQPSSTSSTSDILSTLKMERVRWHPDKIQHRYGMLGIEEQLLRGVTEVFQILDRMWVEERAKLDGQ